MARPNKIYGGINGNTIIGSQSQIRINHADLISNVIGDDFNAYQSHSFYLGQEMDPLTPDHFTTADVPDGPTGKKQTVKVMKSPEELNKSGLKDKSKGLHSIFNKFHAVPDEADSYAWRLSQNMPLVDSPKSRQLQRAMNACTVRDLVQKSQAGLLGTAVYSYSDFMFCKYLGRIPNNYLITLRRYAIPVTDYIKPYGNPSAINGQDKTTTRTDLNGVPLATMVTWLGAPGNDMKEILKYNFSMPFKSINSKFEPDGAPSTSGVSNQSNGAIGDIFKTAFANPIAKSVGNFLMPNMFNPRGGQTIPGRQPHYDDKKAYAGVDMIKSIYIRDTEKGLQFKQSFKLTFDYELRSYDGVNGKQAMLDLLGNILTCCYTQGDFWPGAYRRNASSSSVTPMSSLECMKHHKTFSGYVNAFQNDFQRIKGKVVASIKQDPLKALLSLLDNVGGALLGGDMNQAQPAVKQGVNSLLSDSAVGLWHITIGNPCAPIMTMGNMILTDCQVEHYGPLGIDDFPTGIRVTCTFDHGKPRDVRLIERMYNGGNDRIYVPLDKQVLAQLRKAKRHNQRIAETLGKSEGRRGTQALESNKLLAKKRREIAAAANKMLEGAQNISIANMPTLIDAEDLNIDDDVRRYFGSFAGEVQYAVNIAAGSVGDGIEDTTTIIDIDTGKPKDRPAVQDQSPQDQSTGQ